MFMEVVRVVCQCRIKKIETRVLRGTSRLSFVCCCCWNSAAAFHFASFRRLTCLLQLFSLLIYWSRQRLTGRNGLQSLTAILFFFQRCARYHHFQNPAVLQFLMFLIHSESVILSRSEALPVRGSNRGLYVMRGVGGCEIDRFFRNMIRIMTEILTPQLYNYLVLMSQVNLYRFFTR